MNGSGDNNRDAQSAEDPQASLHRQNERLQLLLNRTSRITSNLDLREVLRAISANFREVMRCDGAGVWLPGEVAGTGKLSAVGAALPKGGAQGGGGITLPPPGTARRAFCTTKPRGAAA